MEDCPCVESPSMYSQESRICRNCPWYLVVGALRGVDFGLTRQEYMRQLISQGHLSNDKLVIAAIAKQYDTNLKAAELSFRRARRVYRENE